MEAVGSSSVRTDVVSVETMPRPTAKPPRVRFTEVLSGGAQALVTGAQAALQTLPGAPMMAVAVRSSTANVSPTSVGSPIGGPTSPHLTLSSNASPEGPGGSSAPSVITGSASSSVGGGDGSLEGSIAQEQQMNLYYLQIQEQVNEQNRTYSALSNVLEVEHNTAKTAIGNIH